MNSRVFRRFKPFFQRLLDKYFDLNRTSGEVGDADFHVDLVSHLASVLKPSVYVELGVNKGETFNRVSRYALESFAIDIDEGSRNYIDNKEAFFHGTTSDFLEYFKGSGKQIDLLFIDADHSKESVKEDFFGYLPLLKEQGVILLHDGYPLNESQTVGSICGDGYKAIWEISEMSKDFEIVTIPFPPGLSICRKRTKQVPWGESNLSL
jgi:hypothetical protein